MPKNVKDDRLQQLRGDLAALRARAAAEFGVPEAGPTHSPTPTESEDRRDPPVTPTESEDRRDPPVTPTAPTPTPAPGPEAGRVDRPIRPSDPDPAMPAMSSFVEDHREDPSTAGPRPPDHAVQGDVVRAGRSGPLPLRRRARRPRPPRRTPFRPRTRRPPPRLAVPQPITVRRRPDYLVGPRWPVWGLWSGTVIVAVLGLAVLQLALRLWTTLNDTALFLGADPSRTDYLHAAAGAAGGGLTLAMAVAALAIVRLRWGYLAGAAGVLLFFGVLPYLAYTATAGIVSAPLPVFEQMIRPSQWDNHALFTLSYWVSLLALVGALADLVWRALATLVSGLRR